MKAPLFWSEPNDTFYSKILRPVGGIYGAITTSRAKQTPKWDAPVPVICIGNLSLGGTGKTPTVLSIGQKLKSLGKNPFVLSRGYGGTLDGPFLVGDQSVKEVGDEPILLSTELPVVVSKDRVSGAKECVDKGADVILMDDGFQNPDLKKDLNICVIDGAVGFGNNRIFPAGPLRETLDDGLKRAQAVLIIGQDQRGIEKELKMRSFERPILKASIQAQDEDLDKKQTYYAFAGIGRPQKFFDTLLAKGFKLSGTKDFADHHVFTEDDLNTLYKAAKRKGAQLICTQKDWVRLASIDQQKIKTMKIDLEWQEEDLLKPLITGLFDDT